MKKIVAMIGLVAVLVSISIQAFAIEDANSRRERLRREMSNYPEQALQAMRNNDPDKAIELLTKVIDARIFKDDPNSLGEIYFRRGNAYRMKKDCASATKDYDSAIKLVQNKGDYFYMRAACKLELKQDDEALADLDQSVKLDPEAVSYRSARCILLFNRKDFAGALPDCEKALAGAPEDKNLLTATAQANEQVGNRPRAAELYRRLLALDPGNPVATEGLKRVGT